MGYLYGRYLYTSLFKGLESHHSLSPVVLYADLYERWFVIDSIRVLICSLLSEEKTTAASKTFAEKNNEE